MSADRLDIVTPHAMICLILLMSMSPHLVSPTNLCATNGLCCKHRDSHCVAQRIQLNHTVDTSELPCYCDHACLHLDDCCPDYKQFCGVSDCRLSEWGPWTPCSSYCGIGHQERRRIVLHQPVNGGTKCPHLLQSKQCRGLACGTEEDQDMSKLIEEHQPKDEITTYEVLTSTEETLKNGAEIIQHETTKRIPEIIPISNTTGRRCMEMAIIRASLGCKHHDDRLHIGRRICIQCLQDELTHASTAMAGGLTATTTTTCTELTEHPIRKFRIGNHCHGKLTFLAETDSLQDCRCAHGLHYELVP